MYVRHYEWLVAYLGGFSTVRYVLKSAMRVCMAGRELGKERSLSRSTVCSIHSSSFVDMPSYSVFMSSISTMRPMIWRGSVCVCVCGGGGGG